MSNILIIDDEKAIRKTLSEILSYEGYKIEEAGDGEEGLKKFNLNNGFKDPTFLREKMTLDFCRRHGITAPRCTYANLYRNDTLWGL